MSRAAQSLTLLLATAFSSLFTACGPSEVEPEASSRPSMAESKPLVIYSGRNKSLIDPILKRFETTTGQATEVRYGDTAELAATLLEEGTATPCDVFIAQDAAALGALARAGLLRSLDEALLQRIPESFRSPDGHWLGLSGRARVVVYNTELVSEDDLPKTLEEVADPKYSGKFGLAPANASFQAHMAVYAATHGQEALTEMLTSITANQPERYPKNSAIVEAVIRGEVEWGLVNHYYLWRALKENPEAPARNFAMPTGDGVANFLNLAGAGVLSEHTGAATLLDFLLTEEAQSYFAQETFEYPLLPSVQPAVELLPLGDSVASQIDFPSVSEALPATLEAISSTGLLQ